MKIFITGGTGLIGRALVPALSSRDHEVVLLTRDARRHETFGMNRRVWIEQGDPTRSGPWQPAVDGVDAVIHLAGASFFSKPWTATRRSELLSSRERATREVVRAIGEASMKPRLLITASSVGIYGEAAGVVDDDAPTGSGFLADLCQRWEDEAAAARSMTQVVTLRFGQVIAPRCALRDLKSASALPREELPLSWIHVSDAVGAILNLLTRSGESLRVNVTSPEPVDVKTLREALGLKKQQGFFARFSKSQSAAADGCVVVLAGQRAMPSRLLALGYNFKRPRLSAALEETRAHA